MTIFHDKLPTRTDCEEAGDYIVPNVLSPRDLVFRPDIGHELYHHLFPLASFTMAPRHALFLQRQALFPNIHKMPYIFVRGAHWPSG